jgi:hypothetical protein
VPAEHAPADEPRRLLGAVSDHEHCAARAEAVEALDGFDHARRAEIVMVQMSVRPDDEAWVNTS